MQQEMVDRNLRLTFKRVSSCKHLLAWNFRKKVLHSLRKLVVLSCRAAHGSAQKSKWDNGRRCRLGTDLAMHLTAKHEMCLDATSSSELLHFGMNVQLDAACCFANLDDRI